MGGVHLRKGSGRQRQDGKIWKEKRGAKNIGLVKKVEMKARKIQEKDEKQKE